MNSLGILVVKYVKIEVEYCRRVSRKFDVYGCAGFGLWLSRRE
jgi:hypothetical protein